ncbi:MAG: biliverdin-producing heme oxygenase [Bacteroidetes bacterium]|nr:biliverdin-producing heme oxygenase [Bacteroidota bacterium]
MFIERLRAETKEAHQILEKTTIPLIKNATNKNEYIRLLSIFYSFYMAIEMQLDLYLDDEIIPAYTKRRKAASILNDIHYFAPHYPVPGLCCSIPSITNQYEAIGVLYVLEGSTLGGKIISKMLKSNLLLEQDAGIRFFSGYGDDNERMWSLFINHINGLPFSPAQQQEAAESAKNTFLLFRQWIEAVISNDIITKNTI